MFRAVTEIASGAALRAAAGAALRSTARTTLRSTARPLSKLTNTVDTADTANRCQSFLKPTIPYSPPPLSSTVDPRKFQTQRPGSDPRNEEYQRRLVDAFTAPDPVEGPLVQPQKDDALSRLGFSVEQREDLIKRYAICLALSEGIEGTFSKGSIMLPWGPNILALPADYHTEFVNVAGYYRHVLRHTQGDTYEDQILRATINLLGSRNAYQGPEGPINGGVDRCLYPASQDDAWAGSHMIGMHFATAAGRWLARQNEGLETKPLILSGGDTAPNLSGFSEAMSIFNLATTKGLHVEAVFQLHLNGMSIQQPVDKAHILKMLELWNVPVIEAQSNLPSDVNKAMQDALALTKKLGRPVAMVQHVGGRFQHASDPAFNPGQREENLITLTKSIEDAIKELMGDAYHPGKFSALLRYYREVAKTSFAHAAQPNRLLTAEDCVQLSNPGYVKELEIHTPKIYSPKVLTDKKVSGGDIYLMALQSLYDQYGDKLRIISQEEPPGIYFELRNIPEHLRRCLVVLPANEQMMQLVADGYAREGFATIIKYPHHRFVGMNEPATLESRMQQFMWGSGAGTGTVSIVDGGRKSNAAGAEYHNSLNLGSYGTDANGLLIYTRMENFEGLLQYAAEQATKFARHVILVVNLDDYTKKHGIPQVDSSRPPIREQDVIIHEINQFPMSDTPNYEEIIITYGLGVEMAKQAAERQKRNITIIEMPFLTHPSKGLIEALKQRVTGQKHGEIIFWDWASHGGKVLSPQIAHVQRELQHELDFFVHSLHSPLSFQGGGLLTCAQLPEHLEYTLRKISLGYTGTPCPDSKAQSRITLKAQFPDIDYEQNKNAVPIQASLTSHTPPSTRIPKDITRIKPNIPEEQMERNKQRLALKGFTQAPSRDGERKSLMRDNLRKIHEERKARKST